MAETTSCLNCAILERRLVTLEEERDKAQLALEALAEIAEASYSDNAWWWVDKINDALKAAGLRP